MNLDRTSWIGIILCFALLFGWQVYYDSQWPQKKRETLAPPAERLTQGQEGEIPFPGKSSVISGQEGMPEFSPVVSTPTLPQLKRPQGMPNEVTALLENENMLVTLSSFGGAIKTIELKKHEDEGNLRVELNRGAAEGIFNLVGWSGDYGIVPYELVSSTSDKIVFRRQLQNGVEVTRTYRFQDNYSITLDQSVHNTTKSLVWLPKFRLNAGTAGPLHLTDSPVYITSSWLAGGGTFRKITVTNFEEGNLLGYVWAPARYNIANDPQDTPLQWLAVNNQFFSLILTPPEDSLFIEVDSQPRLLPQWSEKTAQVPQGIQSEGWLSGFPLAPEEIRLQRFELYAGPKEYSRLAQLDRRQYLVMDFGWFGWVIIPLLSIMRWIHAFVPNWGLSIVFLTILIKSILWPLQTASNKSMKRMQALQPKVEQIREKHRDDPQKMNTEMIELYRDYGINPMGGCLPMLVQMPIFIGFYIMLQSAVELRGQSFLWIHDLTQPDTVAMIPGLDFPINPLPIIMTITTMFLMRMTPQASDNPQMKLFQWLPLVFLFILYKFAAALALYWTVNNLISMVQTYFNLRLPVPELKKTAKK